MNIKTTDLKLVKIKESEFKFQKVNFEKGLTFVNPLFFIIYRYAPFYILLINSVTNIFGKTYF